MTRIISDRANRRIGFIAVINEERNGYGGEGIARGCSGTEGSNSNNIAMGDELELDRV